MKYQGPFPGESGSEKIGVLLINLGTPDSPETGDVRRYLAQFLSDPRVVEMPRLLWKIILHGIILHTRPKRSAEAYRKVWTEAGSPLLTISRCIAAGLQQQLDAATPGAYTVELAMRYGNPSVASGLERLRQTNARRLIILPLYPQYSATTTGSAFDAVAETLRRWRWIPELHLINDYHDNPAYIDALADSVQGFWADHGEPERLLLSFHGIPQEYAEGGDPYPEQCRTTSRLLAKKLGLDESRWALSFQSRFGRQEWIQPYTDQTLQSWGAEGVAGVHVICPGFSADCLETLEEIAVENRESFQDAGGSEFRYIPALNDHPTHIRALAGLILGVGRSGK
jgi:ferrochelatase